MDRNALAMTNQQQAKAYLLMVYGEYVKWLNMN